MVVLNVKRGDAAQFLFETTTDTPVGELVPQLAAIYNGRLRIDRLCREVEQLADHGIMMPPNMMGLTPDQIVDLKLKDDWSSKCYPVQSRPNPDPIGRRTGNAPSEKLAEVLRKTASEARAAVSADQVKANVPLSAKTIAEAIDRIKGAVMIVYPMGLPPHEEVQLMLDDKEDLSGKQASKEVIPEDAASLWWANKELQPEKKLMYYIGSNEKTKLVAKLQRRGAGAPVREPPVDEATQKSLMAWSYKKQEEMKKLDEADDDDYLNAPWADTSALKRSLQGTGNLGWRPK